MPHIVVKLWPGRTAAQKRALTDAIARDVTSILNYGRDAVSVTFEEVAPEHWNARLDEGDILANWNNLTKQPGYGPKPTGKNDRPAR